MNKTKIGIFLSLMLVLGFLLFLQRTEIEQQTAAE